jgi:hypothetical protein
VSAEPIGKMPFPGVAMSRDAKSALPALLERPSAKTGPGTLQRKAGPGYLAVTIGDSKRRSRLELKSEIP